MLKDDMPLVDAGLVGSTSPLFDLVVIRSVFALRLRNPSHSMMQVFLSCFSLRGCCPCYQKM